MVVAHIHDVPDPPSECSELAIPKALNDLILRCLAKKPEDRPQSAEAMARLLDEIEFEQPWTEEQAARWWGTHRPHEGARNSG